MQSGVWTTRRDRALALAQGLHPRLGAASVGTVVLQSCPHSRPARAQAAPRAGPGHSRLQHLWWCAVLFGLPLSTEIFFTCGPTGTVTTVAGCGDCGYRDGPASTAMFNHPFGVAVDGSGAVVVADAGNDCIRRIDLEGMCLHCTVVQTAVAHCIAVGQMDVL